MKPRHCNKCGRFLGRMKHDKRRNRPCQRCRDFIKMYESLDELVNDFGEKEVMKYLNRPPFSRAVMRRREITQDQMIKLAKDFGLL